MRSLEIPMYMYVCMYVKHDVEILEQSDCQIALVLYLFTATMARVASISRLLSSNYKLAS